MKEKLAAAQKNAYNNARKKQQEKRRLENRGKYAGIQIYDDFAHHPTAIEFSSDAIRRQFPSKKILGLVELGSNTMSGGSHGCSLVDSARSLDHVIWLDHQNVLSEKKEISTSKNIDDFVESAKIAAQDYDVILLMTNRDSSKILNPITTYLEKK